MLKRAGVIESDILEHKPKGNPVIAARIPDSVYAKIKDFTEVTGLSVSDTINKILKYHFAKEDTGERGRETEKGN